MSLLAAFPLPLQLYKNEIIAIKKNDNTYTWKTSNIAKMLLRHPAVLRFKLEKRQVIFCSHQKKKIEQPLWTAKKKKKM